MTLLDTNTVIAYLKGINSVVTRLQAARPSELGIPSIVAYELEYGTIRISSARRRSLVSGLLGALMQVPFDHDAAQMAARIRFDLEGRGLLIGPMDLSIAGTALSTRATLVTANTREFSRVKGLHIADWTRQGG